MQRGDRMDVILAFHVNGQAGVGVRLRLRHVNAERVVLLLLWGHLDVTHRRVQHRCRGAFLLLLGLKLPILQSMEF